MDHELFDTIIIIIIILYVYVDMKQSSLIAEARQSTHMAKKKYNKQLGDKNPKLYDEPPHKR